MVALAALAAACGGPQIPQHSGYKSDKSTPWTKPKTLKWSDKGEAKADGDLNYGAFKRAKWFQLDLPSHGDLDVKVDVTPPGDGVNEDFDLGFEIYDPNLHVIAKSDLEDEGAGELNKKKSLKDLAPGKYLVHLYLQGRMDSADFSLGATFRPTGASEVKSDFPAKVMFPSMLAMVPIADDAPANYKPAQKDPPKPPHRGGGGTPRPPQPPPDKKDPPKPPATTRTVRILAVSVAGTGTQITVALGTDNGAAPGQHVAVKGVSGVTTLTACTPRACQAIVSATPDAVKAGGLEATISP